MSEQTLDDVIAPDISHIETDDGAPVDGIRSEKQMRLAAESLGLSWDGPPPEEDDVPRTFAVLANVGLFFSPDQPPLVPDVMVSLDVTLRDDLSIKQNQSYFLWEYGKPPDLVIEIVSNRKGREDGDKMRAYARLGIAYYLIFDPDHHLGNQVLRLYELRHRHYELMTEHWMPALGLGVTLWHGVYEGIEAVWLRWCDIDGELLSTGAELAAEQRQRTQEAQERALQAEERAEQEKERAEQEKERAEQERARAERLAAQLRALGVDPDQAS